MPIQIIRGDEPIHVENIVLTIYGAPGLGKTTLAFTADKPLLLDFDKGAQRAANRQDAVRVNAWSDLENMNQDDVAGYSTIVVDTLGRALDSLSADIIRGNSKMGQNGALTLQGFGQLKARFAAWTKQLLSFGVDLVLVSHMSEEKDGDQIIERLDMQGASKGEVYKVSDVMGRLFIDEKRRVLDFQPGQVAFGKDPAEIGRVNVPHVTQEPRFLAGLIQQTKDSLNALSDEQKARMDAIEEWRAIIEKAKTPAAANKLIAKVSEADEKIRKPVKAILHNHATGPLDLVFDRDAGAYAERPETEDVEPQDEPEPAGPDEGDAIAADAGGPGS